MSPRTRGDLLADLAATINDLTDIRINVELYETEVVEGSKRTRVRKRHIDTFPSLLDALLEAMQPASTGDSSAAGFESRPSAELEPIAVLAMIREQSGVWARALNMAKRRTLADRLHGLISATHTDTQLGNLVHDAHGWLHRAKVATGWETASFTLNQACPYCSVKNALVVTGDLERARCGKCGAEWDEMTVGLLGQMLTANETLETMTQATCESLHGEAACRRIFGHHDEHRDERGHYWLADPDETISA